MGTGIGTNVLKRQKKVYIIRYRERESTRFSQTNFCYRKRVDCPWRNLSEKGEMEVLRETVISKEERKYVAIKSIGSHM